MPFDLDEEAACSSCGKPTIETGALIEYHGKEVCWECLLKITRLERRLFIGGNELLTDEPNIDWVVKGLIESDSTGQLFGPSGGGKSFTALDLVLCVATGQPWNGRSTKQGAVIYLAGEGRTGMKRRIKGWHQHHGKPDLSAFYLSQHTIPFDETATGKIVQAGRDIETITGLDVRFIVADTLSRHMVGDENSTKEMAAYVDACEDIRSQFPGSVWIQVHHTGNSEEAKHRSRGSSALKAAMDFEIHCDKGLLTFTKMKDSEIPEPIPFKLAPVQIGTDEDGEPIISCVVEYGERSQRNQMADLTSNEKMLLELCRCYPNISENDLRSVFYDKRRESEPDVKTDTLRKSFVRAFEVLTDRKLVFLEDQKINIWTPGQTRTNPDLSGTGTPGQTRTLPKGSVSGLSGPAVSPVLPCPNVPNDPMSALDKFISQEVVP